MCLGLPGQVIAVQGNVAEVDFWGDRQQVSLDEMSDRVAPGDYVITHCGSAVRKIDVEEVADTMLMYESVLAECP